MADDRGPSAAAAGRTIAGTTLPLCGHLSSAPTLRRNLWRRSLPVLGPSRGRMSEEGTFAGGTPHVLPAASMRIVHIIVQHRRPTSAVQLSPARGAM